MKHKNSDKEPRGETVIVESESQVEGVKSARVVE